MTFRFIYISVVVCLFAITGFGQIDSVIGQLTSSSAETFAGGISADGRFVVFESRGDLATENPRNADGNREIFLLDYAQRRIFQITDTKSVLINPSIQSFGIFNVRVEIANVRPVISADGRWIAFSSNATSATPAVPNSTNPGAFDGNALTAATPTPTPTVSPTPTPNPTATPTPSPFPSATPTPTPPANPLTADANLEMWLYEVPPFAPVADLSAGDELPVTDLSGGPFTMVTNTDPSQLPRPASGLSGAFVADDNHDASISNDGSVIAFGSTRDLVPSVGNAYPAEDNDEIFTYVRTSATLSQVTKTPRGPISDPIYNKNATISGNGMRVVFASTGDNPIVGMTGGNNPSTSRNEEVFFSDLDATGAPSGTRRQVTTTTPTNPGDLVNILELGRRMSKDGRYIAFDSYADLANENNNANYTSFATYLYDATANTFRRILARSDADSAAPGGDLSRYPGFTDNDANGTPSTLVLETRMNIKADGTVPTTASDGLNNSEVRPAQIYSYPLSVPAGSATFTRLARFPDPALFLSSIQLLTTNSLTRMAFNLAGTEVGTGNFDQQAEVYYFIKPVQTSVQTKIGYTFYSGATHQRLVQSPTPTPSPTASPSPSPSPSVSPTPTPTPVTPPSYYGLTNGMLARLEFGKPQPITARTASSSPKRAPALPFELSGVTMTVNGVACGLKSVSTAHIDLVLPLANATSNSGVSHFSVININGAAIRNTVKLVSARPDIFNTTMTAAPGGRSKLFNVTNRIYTTEPFVIRTIQRHGDTLVSSKLRLYLTGVTQTMPAATVSVRIRDQVVTVSQSTIAFVEPGVYTLDFILPAELLAAGDQPVVVTVTVSGVVFESRLDDTTSKTFIL